MVIRHGRSCLASAFPTLSRRLAQLRIPSILFFILKHFGTGMLSIWYLGHMIVADGSLLCRDK